MPVTFNEKVIAYLTLLSGLAISAVAVYYSVVGLTAIFAAAAMPIIIMGTTLEVSKLIATIWLKQNWSIAPPLIKLYLMTAIFVLMVITSMGIFGFLSKAHLDQSVPSGDVTAQITLIDERINVQRENINVARKALAQLDATVDQTIARSTNERGATNAANLRRSQIKERSQLQDDITTAQAEIKRLSEEKIPIASTLRKVEAEVGPVKYIAGFFYGQTDQAILEKAVTWVIITLIIVFDPLAVILLLASQTSFQNFRERSISHVTPEKKSAYDDSIQTPQYPKDNGPLTENQINQIKKIQPETTSTNVKEALFVQNEEQTKSNLWTVTTTSNITEEEYIMKAKKKLKDQNER